MKHYLKKKLKDNYCIILSQAYINTETFNYILFWNKVTELKL